MVAPTVEYCVNGCTPHSCSAFTCHLSVGLALTRFGVPFDTSLTFTFCGSCEISNRQPVVTLTYHDVIDAFDGA